MKVNLSLIEIKKKYSSKYLTPNHMIEKSIIISFLFRIQIRNFCTFLCLKAMPYYCKWQVQLESKNFRHLQHATMNNKSKRKHFIEFCFVFPLQFFLCCNRLYFPWASQENKEKEKLYFVSFYTIHNAKCVPAGKGKDFDDDRKTENKMEKLK